jgi:hypothetical protein
VHRSKFALVFAVIFFVIAFTLTMLYAQDPHAQEPHDHAAMHAANATPLHLAGKVRIPTEPSRPVYKPAHCDEHGNIYFRAYQPEERKVPVVRVDARADGTGKATRYSLDPDAAFATATAYDFSVLPNGNLYQPVQLGKDVYIVGYDKQPSDSQPSDKAGTIRWKARLEKQFWVSRLVAFDDSKFLVIGTEPQSPTAPTETRTYHPVVAIFDATGHLVRNVSLSDKSRSDKSPADKPAQPGEQNDEKTTSPPLLAVLSADGQAGMGGRVYLMVHSEPAVVYAIDATGSVVGTWEITAPAERMTAISMSLMSLEKNQIAVEFRHSFQGMSHGEDIISVFNLKDGDLGHGDLSHGHRAAEAARFSVPAELSSSVLGCLVGNDAVFVGPDAVGPDTPGPKSLVIQHAVAAKR